MAIFASKKMEDYEQAVTYNRKPNWRAIALYYAFACAFSWPFFWLRDIHPGEWRTWPWPQIIKNWTIDRNSHVESRRLAIFHATIFCTADLQKIGCGHSRERKSFKFSERV